MRQRSRVTRSTASVAASTMIAAGLIALAPQAAQAASGHVTYTLADGPDHTWTVPANVNSVKITAKGAAGGQGGFEGGRGGQGATGVVTLDVNEGDEINVELGARGTNAGANSFDQPGAGGSSTFGAGAGGGLGSDEVAPVGATGAGGGGGGATAVKLGTDLVVVAGGGGGGGGTAEPGKRGGRGGDAGHDGAAGEAGPGAVGGEAGAAGSQDGEEGDASVGTGSGAGGGGGGGYQGGSQGEAAPNSGAGGGGGGTNHVNTLLAQLVGSWTADVDGDGAVTIEWSSEFNTTISFAGPIALVTGQSTTIPVIVTADAGGEVPSGTLTATVENTVTGATTSLGTKTLSPVSGAADPEASATFNLDGLKVGSYTVTATYTPDGDSDSLASTGSESITVAQGDTTTQIAGPSDVPVVGDPVTFGAVVQPVAPAQGTPSGKVLFTYDGNTLGSGPVTLDSSGYASITVSSLPASVAGDNIEVKAEYLGDDEFTGSDASLTNFVVNTGDVTVTLESDHNPVVRGDKTYLTVTVKSASSSAPKPDGIVKIFNGLAQVASGPVDAAGQYRVALDLGLTTVDGHNHLRAEYSDDSNYNDASSNSLDQVVNFGDATVNLSSDINPSEQGETVTFTVELDPSNPSDELTPSGKVQFYINGAPFNGPQNLSVAGDFALPVDSLPVGTSSIQVHYLGDEEFNGAWSLPLAQTVKYAEPTGTNTAVSVTDPVVTGQSTSYEVVVTGASTPVGSARAWLESHADGTEIDLGTKELVDGKVKFHNDGQLVGRYTVKAKFIPAENEPFLASTGVVEYDVAKGDVTASIAGPADVSTLGEEVEFGVTVRAADPAKGTPSGDVTFLADGAVIQGGTVTLDAEGRAVLRTKNLAVGSQTITVNYAGDSEFNALGGAAALADVVVNKGDVSVTLIDEHNPVIKGELSKFTVKVESLTGGAIKPTGDVELYSDNGLLATESIHEPSGTATFYLDLGVTEPAGHHHIRANYLGDTDNFNSAYSGWVDHVVSYGDTQVSLSSNLNPTEVGANVIFDVAVTGTNPSAGVVPSGKVQVLINGALHNGPASLTATGTYQFEVDDLPVGANTVLVRYLGDANFKPNTSESLIQVVKRLAPVASTTTVVPNNDPIVTGQSNGYAVTVTPTPAGRVPTGSVEVTAESHEDGTITVLGTKNLVNGKATVYKDGLLVGDYTIWATYMPDAASDVLGSIGEAELTVEKGDVDILVNGPLEVPALGDSVQLSASVSALHPAKGTPTGKVRFYQVIGATELLLGTVDLVNGHATLNTTGLKVGVSDIVVSYLGDREFNAAPLVAGLEDFAVNPGSVDVSIEAEHNPVIVGEKAMIRVKVAPVKAGGPRPTGEVTLFNFDEVIAGPEAIDEVTGEVLFALDNLDATEENGHYHLRASYDPAGDDNYEWGVSPWLDLDVLFGDAKVKLSSDVNPSKAGNNVTFSIDVDGTNPTAATTPTGQVQLYIGGNPFNGPVDIDADGKAQITTDAVPVGENVVYARYLGDAKYNESRSEDLTQVVQRQSADVVLTANATTLQYAQKLTLSARVTKTDDAGTVPSGWVQFYDQGQPVGLPVIIDKNGIARVTSTKVAKGTHQFTARYLSDDKTIDGVSQVVRISIKQNTVKFRLITDKVPAFEGEDVLLHARVEPSGTSKGKIAGTIQYYSDSKKIGAPIPVNGLNWGSTMIRDVTAGSKRYSARFTPSSVSPYEPAFNTGGVVQRVLKGKPNTKVSISGKRVSDTSIRVRVRVRKSGGFAPGSVQLYVDGRPSKKLKLSSKGTVRTTTLTGVRPENVFVTANYRPSSKKLTQSSKTITVQKRR